MLQSQFNLDHRLAELHQVGAELRLAQAARSAQGPLRSVGASIRSLLRGTPPASRAAGFSA
jgi:hypothetical protein